MPSTGLNLLSCVQGVDFFFSNRAHATKFVDFLSNVVPVRYRNDKQLVSHNTHTSTYNYKYTYSVEIAPICRVYLINHSSHNTVQIMRHPVSS